MAKVFVVLLALVAGAFAEPPVESSYLPPRHRNPPSGLYGPPGFHGFAGSNEIERTATSTSYLPPSNALDNIDSNPGRGYPEESARLSETYGVPTQQDQSPVNFDSDSVSVDSALTGNSRQLPSTYGAPSRFEPSSASALSSTYGTPKTSVVGSARSKSFHQSSGSSSFSGRPSSSRAFSSNFNRPAKTSFKTTGFRSASSYAPRNNEPSSRYTSAIPSNTYGVLFNSAADNNFATPLSTYGAPAAETGSGYQRQFESSGYPRKTTTEDPLAEPAAYEYNYEVQRDSEFGAEFGHKENRENEATRGVYHVLLPDGRMQIVEYEADETGYRPQIRYEDIGYSAARSGHPGY